MDDDMESPSGSSASSTRVSARKMALETLAFFIPILCFPVLDLAFRALWDGRPSNELPFPPVILSFLTGGASILVTCGVVAMGFTDAAYLYFICANMAYIILFLFGNVTSLTGAPSMANVSPEDWRVNVYFFFFLFTFFQLAFNSALRRNGASIEDLGVFGRVTDFIWNHVSNSSGGATGGINLTLAGNPSVIEQSSVSPPAYEDYNVSHNTLLFTDEWCYSLVPD